MDIDGKMKDIVEKLKPFYIHRSSGCHDSWSDHLK
jgi:hypothetical protein